MNTHTNVLIYSKFSQACRKFFDMMEASPSFKEKSNMLCIDNKDARDRILKSDKLKISEVPSILRIYQDNGYVEIFEGEKAFILLSEYIAQEKPKTPPPPPPPPPQPVYQPQPPQEIDDNSMSRLSPAKLPQKSSMQQNQKLINMSSLEDLGDSVEIRDHSIEVPNKVQNKNVHFDIEQENQQRNVPERSLKQAGNIVSIALQMQKDREEAPSGRPSM